jgi:hypothetical protein
MKALESLPGWIPYGVEGPYPWGMCMKFLEKWLRENNGIPPAVDIHKGGYVGLDASPMERLSGCLTCINQGDGKSRQGTAPGSGFTVSAEKQADLDRICGQFGLRWRKARGSDGALIKGGPKTFIQEAYARFKEYYKMHGPEGEYIKHWFNGFPLKHAKQESLEVQNLNTKITPPKRTALRIKKRNIVRL